MEHSTKKFYGLVVAILIFIFFSNPLYSQLQVQTQPMDNIGYATVTAGIGYIPKIGFVTHNPALNVGFAMGVKCFGLRYEGEFGYLQASNRSFVGQANFFKVMANMYYDFDLAKESLLGFIPYVGGGIGWGDISHSAPSGTLEGQIIGKIPHDKNTINRSVFAYQGMAGFHYILTPNLTSRIFYNYLGTSRPRGFAKIFQQHSANVGFSYYFLS